MFKKMVKSHNGDDLNPVNSHRPLKNETKRKLKLGDEIK